MFKHGKCETPEYITWCAIKNRCYNPNYSRYRDYGGRGIWVCRRWRWSFEQFYKDMGPKPSLKHSIERKDNDGAYTPLNCVWATRAQQDNNKRVRKDAHFITYNGAVEQLATWSRITGINEVVLRHRVNSGWSGDKLFSAVKHKPHKKRVVDGPIRTS